MIDIKHDTLYSDEMIIGYVTDKVNVLRNLLGAEEYLYIGAEGFSPKIVEAMLNLMETVEQDFTVSDFMELVKQLGDAPLSGWVGYTLYTAYDSQVAEDYVKALFPDGVVPYLIEGTINYDLVIEKLEEDKTIVTIGDAEYYLD